MAASGHGGCDEGVSEGDLAHGAAGSAVAHGPAPCPRCDQLERDNARMRAELQALRDKHDSQSPVIRLGDWAGPEALAELVNDEALDRSALEQRLSTLSAAFDHVQRLGRVGAWWQNQRSGRMDWSSGLSRILGEPSPPQVDTATLLSFVHPEDRGKFEAMKRRCERDGAVEPRDMRLCLQNGAERRVSVEMDMLRETPVRPGLWVGVLVDVTDRDTLQRELRVVKQREVVGRLAAGVVHDFSNLVQVIELEARSLQQGLDGDVELREHVQAILDVNQRASVVIRRLLGMTRRVSTSAVPMNLNVALRRLSELLSLAAGPRVRLRFDLEDVRHQVVCDPTDLEQVVLNLVVNARDATASGGEVVLRTRLVEAPSQDPLQHERLLLLSVEDQGAGMSEEVQARALQPFFTTKGERGTGLGLSTAREVMESYGGTLSLRSREGEGTTVSLRFPVLERNDEVRAESTSINPSLLRGCVLVVDDEPAVYAGVEDALWRRGLRCVVADSGEQALRQLDERGDEIVAVLTDLSMEPMSGIELGRRVRERFPDLPMLYMTGLLETPWAEQIDAPLLRKPFSPDELVRLLGRATGSHARRAQVAGEDLPSLG